jgi:hypothetical protein
MVKNKTFLLVCISWILFPLFLEAQSYSQSPWLFVNEYTDSEKYLAFLAELGEPETWKAKGIKVEENEFEEIVEKIILYSDNSSYPHTLPYGLKFNDSKKEILEKLSAFNPVVVMAGTIVCIEPESSIYMRISSNGDYLKRGIDEISIYVDMEEQYRKYDKSQGLNFLQVRSDTSYAEIFSKVFQDRLYDYKHIIPSSEKVRESAYDFYSSHQCYVAKIESPSKRKGRVALHGDGNRYHFGYVKIPIWENTLDVNSMNETELSKAKKLKNQKIESCANNVVQGFDDLMVLRRYKKLAPWRQKSTLKNPKIALDAFTKLSDTKLKHDYTARVVCYEFMENDRIKTELDVIIYHSFQVYDDLVGK